MLPPPPASPPFFFEEVHPFSSVTDFCPVCAAKQTPQTPPARTEAQKPRLYKKRVR